MITNGQAQTFNSAETSFTITAIEEVPQPSEASTYWNALSWVLVWLQDQKIEGPVRDVVIEALSFRTTGPEAPTP